MHTDTTPVQTHVRTSPELKPQTLKPGHVEDPPRFFLGGFINVYQTLRVFYLANWRSVIESSQSFKPRTFNPDAKLITERRGGWSTSPH